MIQSCRHCHCATVLPLQRAFHPPLQMRSCQQCVVHWVRGAAQTNDLIVDHTHATHWPLPDPRSYDMLKVSLVFFDLPYFYHFQVKFKQLFWTLWCLWDLKFSTRLHTTQNDEIGFTWVQRKSHSSVTQSSCRISYRTRVCKSLRQLRQTALSTACWARGTRARQSRASSSGSAGMRSLHGSSLLLHCSSLPLRLLDPVSVGIFTFDAHNIQSA